MDILKYNPANVQPVSAVYIPDSDVSFKNVRDYFDIGVDITFIEALSSLQDTTVNKHTNFYLSEQRAVPNILQTATPKQVYPIYRTTYLSPAGSTNYLVTNSNTGIISISGTELGIDNRYFVELEILSPEYMAVRHYDGESKLKYLTFNANTSADLMFKDRKSRVDNDLEKDTQIFKYILDDTNSTLSLFTKLLSSEDLVHEELLLPSIIESSGTVLSARAIPTNESVFNSNNVFNIRPINAAPVELDLQTTWNSYTSAVEHNLLNVSESRSYKNIKNNYLISTNTNSISTTMGVNLFPLKNQVTVEGRQSRNNPYNVEEDVVHRDYNNLHTGTHQEAGADSIYLNYTSNVKEITLPTDKLTYFHIPHIFDPYEQLNVNDSTLIKSGAIWADTPIKSDKIFKKRGDDYNIAPPRDMEDGTWLCAWLSGSSDPFTSPIWVDRYYNPGFASTTTALTAGTIDLVQWIDKFESVTEKLSAQDKQIYDKVSDLVFEPGILYAYDHVGRGNSQKIINSLKDNILVEDLEIYKDYANITLLPSQVISEPIHTMQDGVIMTGEHHQGDSIVVPKMYEFNRDNHGATSLIKSHGSFTLNFWMYCNDWATPFGDQILGNYTSRGFGIFNESFVTPLVIIPDGNRVLVFNSDYKHIDTNLNNKTIKQITKRGGIENYWFVDSNNDIYEYDVRGVIQNKITSSHLTGKTIYDIEVDSKYVYVITNSLNGIGEYFRYDLSNQLTSYVGDSLSANIWNYGVTPQDPIDPATQIPRIHSVSKGLSSSTGIVLTFPDISSPQGSVVDNNGMPWVIQNNYLYTYDTSVSSNIIGISASDTQTLESVNCDKDNNIWLLYGDTKVAKFNTNRNILFTTSLSTTPFSSTRYLDFIYEFTDKGYEGSANILNQSVSGARTIKLDLSGRHLSDYSLVSGTDVLTNFATSPKTNSWKTTTGFDFLRKNKLNTSPRLEAKVALSNLYNSSTTTAAFSSYSLTYNLSGLKDGWHNFNVSLDAEKGVYQMQIDSTIVDQVALPITGFSFSHIFNQPLTIGSSPFYSALTLSEHLQQPRYYLAGGIKIKQLKLYSSPLDYFDARAHYLILGDVENIKWDIPCGQRNYVDTVERVFKHRLPGRRSEIFNVNIKGLEDITDSQVKAAIQDRLQDKLGQIAPMYTKLNLFRWGTDYTTALSGTSALSNISTAAPKGASGSTTPTNVGTTNIYDY